MRIPRRGVHASTTGPAIHGLYVGRVRSPESYSSLPLGTQQDMSLGTVQNMRTLRRTARRTARDRDPRPTPQIPTPLGTQPPRVGT